MKSILRCLAAPLTRLIQPEFTVLDGTRIPAGPMRCGGRNFADDRDFLATGEREAKRLLESFGLNDASRVLEIGCGPGRLPTGILRAFGEVQCYLGLDVRADAVDWGNEHIGQAHPNFCFRHVNAHNARYNPRGEGVVGAVELPVDGGRFDIAYLYSVFSHMTLEDVRRYLSAIHDVLRPSGRLFFTTFVEADVPDFEVNPAGYKQDWKGELHCVRFERDFLERTVNEAGFTLDEFHYGTEADGQSALYLTRKD